MSAERVPNCFVAGAPRCGTTFFSLALAEHPDAYLCDMKEPHYFGAPPGGYHYDGPGDSYLNGTWIHDRRQYLDLYAGRPERWWVDGSTNLMFWPEAVGQIEAHGDRPHYFVVLREPVARAVSAYKRLRAQGLEPADSLAAAVDDELAGNRATWSPGFRYVEQGLYAEPLDVLGSLVGDRLHVIRFVDLIGDPEAVVRAAWASLDLSPDAEFVAPSETNATPHVSNPLLRYLFVRPLRVRTMVARHLPRGLVDRLKQVRAADRSAGASDDVDTSSISHHFDADLERLRRDRGLTLAEPS